MAKKRGRPKKKETQFKEMLRDIIPINDMFEEDEADVFNKLVETYLKDFDEENLSANDMDDIMSISINKVLEFRLLKNSKGNPDKILDISNSVDKLRKQTEKLKESLATRRRDRIDPRKREGFSILDLAASYDKEKKDRSLSEAKAFFKEEEKLKKSSLLVGNRNDLDASILKKG